MADKSKIQNLNEKLYSRSRYKEPTDSRTPVRPIGGEVEVGKTWQGPELDEMLQQERTPPVIHPWMKRIFIGALLFFVATVVVGGFIFFGGTNFISSRNVDINIVGPTTASAGESIELGVSVINNNNADLELANLSVQYPSGARDKDDTTKTLTFTKEELGVIEAGREVVANILLVLIGAPGEVKEIKFSVEYKVKGSSATFYKDKVYEIAIGSAPVTIKVESPDSVTSGDLFTTRVIVTLNSTEILKGVTLKVEYPYGYSVDTVSPSAISDNNLWNLGDLAPGESKTIQIRGRLVGENREERTMRFYVGVSESGRNTATLGNVVVSTLETTEIARPAIGLDVALNSVDALTYVAPIGGTISTSIRFQNNLPEKLFNPRLEVKLSGTLLDETSIMARDNGFYNSSNNTATWNIANDSGLFELSPGEGGTFTLSFSSLANTQPTSSNSDINVEVILSGTSANSNRAISVSEKRTVRVSSQASLSAKALYSRGPFSNTGSIPPRAEERTTYTIAFEVGNTSNALDNAVLTAKVGQGVDYITSTSNDNESVGYDSLQGILTWNLGTVASGTGFSLPNREIAIQIELVPSIIQVGSAPVLINNIVLSGVDAVSGQSVTVSHASLTTRLTSDPAFIQGDDIVAE